jgi:hypothetical protein
MKGVYIIICPIIFFYFFIIYKIYIKYRNNNYFKYLQFS